MPFFLHQNIFKNVTITKTYISFGKDLHMIEEWNRNMNSIPDSFFGKNLPISPSEKKNQHIFERPFAKKYFKKKELSFFHT